MYYAWRFHGKYPSEIYWLPVGERNVLYSFIRRELEQRAKEAQPDNGGDG